MEGGDIGLLTTLVLKVLPKQFILFVGSGTFDWLIQTLNHNFNLQKSLFCVSI